MRGWGGGMQKYCRTEGNVYVCVSLSVCMLDIIRRISFDFNDLKNWVHSMSNGKGFDFSAHLVSSFLGIEMTLCCV